MNVFSDDWEKALSEIHQRKVTIDQAGSEKLSEEYLNAKFVFKYKEKILKYKLIGQELEKDMLRIYLELPQKYIEKGLLIKNDCLIAEFDEQVNIVNSMKLNQKKTLVFKELNQFQELK